MAKAKRTILPSKSLPSQTAWLWSDSAFEERCPALYEFLACGIVDGEPRKGGSITLFVSQARLKVCFLDKTTQMAFYGVLEPGIALWEELEGMLAGEHEPWQPSKSGGGGKPVF